MERRHECWDDNLVQKRVLITGATGSVGTTALQLAKYTDAEVTGICHSSQRELALELGASDVLAYDRGELPRPETNLTSYSTRLPLCLLPARVNF